MSYDYIDRKQCEVNTVCSDMMLVKNKNVNIAFIANTEDVTEPTQKRIRNILLFILMWLLFSINLVILQYK